MSATQEGWRALRSDDLPHLGDVWRVAPAERPPLDPGLLWWDTRHGRTLTPSELASTALPVLIQARDGKTAASLSEHGLFGAPTLNNTLQRFSTGFVRPADLARLVGAAQSVQLASAAAVPALAHTIAPVSAAASPIVGDSWTHPLLGVIDDGCAFLNPCFAESTSARTNGEPSRSRVRWLWDQDVQAASRSTDSWRSTAFGYGAELTAAGFDTAHAPGEELAGYRAIEYLVDGVGQAPSLSHGTFVSGLAAGDLDGLLQAGTGYSGGGPAADAHIAFVALPRAAFADTSGRSLAVHLPNAIRYVLSKAARTQPVVINASLGHHGGPHDGSDLLSGALTELVEAEWQNGRPVVIVTGAGNGFDSRTHAHWQNQPNGLPQGVPARWFWDLPAGDASDSFMNIWSDRELGVGMTAPGGVESSVQVVPHQAAIYWSQGRAISLVANLPRPATGAGCLIHVAVAPTDVLHNVVGAMAGAWSLVLQNSRAEPCRWDAWVDRDDAPFGSRAVPRAPSALRDADPQARVISERRTLNGLANPALMLIASAARLDNGALCAYSASGGGRAGRDDYRPLVAMPADESAAVQGLPGPGVLGGSVRRVSGTSVASAVLSRQAVAVLHANPTPADAAAFRRELLDLLAPAPTALGDEFRAGAGVARSHLFSGTPSSASITNGPAVTAVRLANQPSS